VKLYEIGQARDVLDGWLAEQDGEVTPDLEALLAELELARDEKITRVALFIREQRQRADATKAEIQRLGALLAATERGIAGLERYLVTNMQVLEVVKVESPVVRVALRANPPKVEGEVPEALLREWWEQEQTLPECPSLVRYEPPKAIPESFALDKKAVVDLWKRQGDVAVPEGLRVTQGVRVEIK